MINAHTHTYRTLVWHTYCAGFSTTGAATGADVGAETGAGAGA